MEINREPGGGGRGALENRPAYLWRLWIPALPEGDPRRGAGPAQTSAFRKMSNRALGRAHSRPAVARGDWISDGAGLFPSGFPSLPTSLVLLLNW